jgi:anti-anti-sigma regulatory factor
MNAPGGRRAAPSPELTEVVDRGTGTIRAAGRLTELGADLLCGTIEDLRRHGWLRIILDLEGVQAADDAARDLLVDLRASLGAGGGRLVLRHLPARG